MKKILVFRTSVDATMERLFCELGRCDIDCLVQSSQFTRYRETYPYINFMDIRREDFYDLPFEVAEVIRKKSYDQVYVTFSGIKGHNFGNVMELVSKVSYKKAFFYNCHGTKTEIPGQNRIKDMLCRAYIRWILFIHG